LLWGDNCLAEEGGCESWLLSMGISLFLVLVRVHVSSQLYVMAARTGQVHVWPLTSENITRCTINSTALGTVPFTRLPDPALAAIKVAPPQPHLTQAQP